MKRSGMILLSVVLLAACSTNNKKSSSRYALEQDRAPAVPAVDISQVKEPTPKVEPKSKWGNRKTYEVWGKTYQVLDNADQFEQVGYASWYGEKFHGHRTSNGEVYDMYSFTAAHKNLPLPTFLKVTNLENEKSVVVRVNDRGPFHDQRIVDLSYAAATRLGFVGKGVAKVKIEAIDPSLKDKLEPPKIDAQVGDTLQVGSFLNIVEASSFQTRLASLVTAPVYVEQKKIDEKQFHRVRIGPFGNDDQIKKVLEVLTEKQIRSPLLIPGNPLPCSAIC